MLSFSMLKFQDQLKYHNNKKIQPRIQHLNVLVLYFHKANMALKYHGATLFFLHTLLTKILYNSVLNLWYNIWTIYEQ